mmetsp:Transcript_22459/g.76298  ORF Transcript_22459/g.76298 Transcript_22459/m.76298 type:complete len:218 (-) Transcript_22459:739-1392(-)
MREPRLRPLQGAPRRGRPHTRDAGQDAHGRAGHTGRGGGLRPRESGCARSEPRRHHPAEPRAVAGGPRCRHPGGHGGDPRAAQGEVRHTRPRGLRGHSHGKERHHQHWLRAVCSAGRGGGRQDGVHVRPRAEAGVGARVGRDHRVRVHRPRVRRRVHGAGLGGYVHRGRRQDHAGVRRRGRQARRAHTHQAAQDRLRHGRVRHQGDPGCAGREARGG